ncbi:hypothetical protein [Streptomyces sp. NPDC002690]
MTNPIEMGARAAAQRVTTQHTPTLVADVEVAIHARETTSRPNQYLDPISLGSLIVSIATLAWTMYKDSKKDGSAPRTEVITRRVRIQLQNADAPGTELGSAEQARIIEATVEETLNAAQADQSLED